MDVATGLMMTCVALLQEAETPLGQTAVVEPGAEGVEQMAESIRTAFEEFEQQMAARGGDREQVYAELRRGAQRSRR